jgi:hypothetical protein
MGASPRAAGRVYEDAVANRARSDQSEIHGKHRYVESNMQHLNGHVGVPVSNLESTGIPAFGYWSRTECLSMADDLIPHHVSAGSLIIPHENGSVSILMLKNRSNRCHGTRGGPWLLIQDSMMTMVRLSVML